MARTRPPLRSGSATRQMQHNAEVRRRLDDAAARHRDKLADLAARRVEVQASGWSAARIGASLARIAQAITAEQDRHRRAMARQRERLR